MTKDKRAKQDPFRCTECGWTATKWVGRCGECQAWGSVEEVGAPKKLSLVAGHVTQPATPIGEVDLATAKARPTKIEELDRVLGGGIVPGAAILLAGEPGVGKSTLLLTVAAQVATNGVHTLYISGEESASQVRLRAERIGAVNPNLWLAAETDLSAVIAHIDAVQPQLLIIDSIQTLYSETIPSAPGSVTQVRQITFDLMRIAKEKKIAIFIIGHITKEGSIAGPRVLEHMVDVVLYFEGDTHSSFRLVRAFKNRFGAVNELGVFAMTDKGLKGVANPSALFLSQHDEMVPGSCVMVTQEGTRPLLVEIQALVDAAHAPNPRRIALGLEQHRLAMLLAVLHRHAGVACFDQDVFLNAVGGVKIAEPAADLPVLLAIQSSLKNTALPKTLVAFGEVGLAGEIRPCPRGQERLKEAAKLGFKSAIIPLANRPKTPIPGLEIIAVDRVDRAIAALREFN